MYMDCWIIDWKAYTVADILRLLFYQQTDQITFWVVFPSVIFKLCCHTQLSTAILLKQINFTECTITNMTPHWNLVYDYVNCACCDTEMTVHVDNHSWLSYMIWLFI